MSSTYMQRPQPWQIEEQVGAGRISLRCSELEGGCGDVTEIAGQKVLLAGMVWPGYVRWWREHARCNKAAADEQQERAQNDLRVEKRRMAVFIVRTVLRHLITVRAFAMDDAQLEAMVQAALARERVLEKGMAQRLFVPIAGEVLWRSGPEAEIWRKVNHGNGIVSDSIAAGAELFVLAREALAIPYPAPAAESEAAHEQQ